MPFISSTPDRVSEALKTIRTRKRQVPPRGPFEYAKARKLRKQAVKACLVSLWGPTANLWRWQPDLLALTKERSPLPPKRPALNIKGVKCTLGVWTSTAQDFCIGALTTLGTPSADDSKRSRKTILRSPRHRLKRAKVRRFCNMGNNLSATCANASRSRWLVLSRLEWG